MSIHATSTAGTISAQVNSVALKSPTKAKPDSQPVDSNPKAAQPKSNLAVKDTVQISSAGQAAFQEATETAAQTAQEAGKGDRQAQKLLAKEQAAKEVTAPQVNQNESTLKSVIS